MKDYFCSLSSAIKYGLELPDPPLLFVTGGPGVGKSFFIKSVSRLALHLKVGSVATTAFMGIAAVNIEGKTINSLFKIIFGKKTR